MSALEEARARTAEVLRQKNLHDPKYWKAQEEIVLARELELEEAELTDLAERENEVQLRYREHQVAMDELVEAIKVFCDARTKLADLELLLQKAEGRARRAGIPPPAFDSLTLRASRHRELDALRIRAQKLIAFGGFFGAR